MDVAMVISSLNQSLIIHRIRNIVEIWFILNIVILFFLKSVTMTKSVCGSLKTKDDKALAMPFSADVK